MLKVLSEFVLVSSELASDKSNCTMVKLQTLFYKNAIKVKHLEIVTIASTNCKTVLMRFINYMPKPMYCAEFVLTACES